MLLIITDTGRYAVRHCADGLSDMQLRLLALADGTRERETLLQECARASPALARQALDDLLELELVASVDSAAARRVYRVRPRRSVAAGKMYMLGIFELLRSPGVASVRDALRECRDERDLMQTIAESLAVLEQCTSTAYVNNVLMQLQHLMPARNARVLNMLMVKTLRERGARDLARRGAEGAGGAESCSFQPTLQGDPDTVQGGPETVQL
jgi:hypothetical protein